MDVRPVIARGEHPLVEVLAAADAMEPLEVLELIAPFEPRPLMARLRDVGCEVVSQRQDDGTWLVRAGKGQLPPLEELTLLPAPEPLERVLESVSGLQPGAVFTAHLPRDPLLLKPHLDSRGLAWRVALRPDGSAVLWVRG
jgi:uncharacterized protein (DUF2249 family)